VATTPTARVAPWKRQEVEDLTNVLKDTPVVALARIDKLPSRQFQQVRAKVREQATIRVTKNTLLERALPVIEPLISREANSMDFHFFLSVHVKGKVYISRLTGRPFYLDLRPEIPLFAIELLDYLLRALDVRRSNRLALR
jgi:large subunit ribosomal protein L10